LIQLQELGGRILFATDDWFAAAENLLESSEPVWKEGFTPQVWKFTPWYEDSLPGIRIHFPGKGIHSQV